jgi:hypothetical protein
LVQVVGSWDLINILNDAINWSVPSVVKKSA